MESDLQSVTEVLDAADALLGRGERAAARVCPTGFHVLDTYLGGGLRAGELSLLGGPQGLGKTTFALQIARNAAIAGETVVVLSYEHDASTLLQRLLTLESGELLGVEGMTLRTVREALEAKDGTAGSLAERLIGSPAGPQSVEALRKYADRLLIHRGQGSRTDLAEIREVALEAQERTGKPPLLVVDYLQKVPVPDGPDSEEERITIVVEGLKDMALELGVPVLAIVAADKTGLESGKRLRIHHLRGSSALAYEADVVLVLNDKFDVVARHHLVYDVGNAERYHNWVVCSIEKNRSGLDRVDVEFRKRFEQARFESDGQPVMEQLLDERVYTD